MKKLLLVLTLATLSGCATGTVKPVADQERDVENESMILETWKCSERYGSSKTLVTATIFEVELVEDIQFGSIEVAGKVHVAVYSVEGFNRRWDFGTGDDASYAFIIEPDGDSTYYDFNFADDNGRAKGRLFFKCRQK